MAPERPRRTHQALAACAAAFCLLLTPCHAVSTASTDGYRFIDCGAEGEDLQGTGQYQINDGSFNMVYQVNGTSGNASVGAAAPGVTSLNLTEAERSLRNFTSEGGCYIVQVNPRVSRYNVRLGFAYYNYDGKNKPPSFTVIVNGITVDLISLADWEDPEGGPDTSPSGGKVGEAHYTEYITDFPGGAVIVCLVVANDPTFSPILNTLEIIPMPDKDPLSTWLGRYTATGGDGLVLSLKHRMNLGGPAVTDDLRRLWHAENNTNDAFYVQDPTKGIGHTAISTSEDIQNLTTLPLELMQTAWQGSASVPASQALGLALHFYPFSASTVALLARVFLAELDPSVKAGERVFTISLAYSQEPFTTNKTEIVSGPYTVDIVGELSTPDGASGALTATFQPMTACFPPPQNPGTVMVLWLSFAALPGSTRRPIINGLELTEVISANETAGCPFVFPPPSPDSGYPTNSAGLPPGGSPSQGGVSAGAIVGIVLAALAFVFIVGGVTAMLLSKRREEKKAMEFQRFESETNVENGEH